MEPIGTSGHIIEEVFVLHTPTGNSMFFSEHHALEAKSKLDEEFEKDGLSKKAPLYRAKLKYEVY